MTTKPLILAAAALATGYFALGTPTAEAGGVRLSFGGPLGSFTARPTQGYAPSYGAPGCDKPKSYSSAARYHKPEPKKPVSVASRKHHDDEDDDKTAKAKRKVATAKAEKNTKSDTSSAPSQIASNAIPLPAVKTDAPVTSPAPAPVKLDAESAQAAAAPLVQNTALVTTAAAAPSVEPETKPETRPEPKTEAKTEPKPVAKTETKPAKTAEKKTDCRRFNPTAGITISVRCND